MEFLREIHRPYIKTIYMWLFQDEISLSSFPGITQLLPTHLYTPKQSFLAITEYETTKNEMIINSQDGTVAYNSFDMFPTYFSKFLTNIGKKRFYVDYYLEEDFPELETFVYVGIMHLFLGQQTHIVEPYFYNYIGFSKELIAKLECSLYNRKVLYNEQLQISYYID